MSGFDPAKHPRGPDGKFRGGPGTRGSQRRLERIGKAVRNAFVGDQKPRRKASADRGPDGEWRRA